mmetsp:Transcript_49955/g.96463  ORF Transcript_49955/g.96463 Transcript_49955/m.96463 type:complete len:97 (+) Transcript_49955:569-859(+)
MVGTASWSTCAAGFGICHPSRICCNIWCSSADAYYGGCEVHTSVYMTTDTEVSLKIRLLLRYVALALVQLRAQVFRCFFLWCCIGRCGAALGPWSA